MNKTPPRTRQPVKAVARLASRGRRCSQNGALTAPVAGSIRIGASSAERLPSDAPQRGRLEVMEMYFDAEGRPIKRKGVGAERVARAYDARGNQVEEAYFNAEGKPTIRQDVGAARIAWRYDDAGRRVEAAFYGADGAQIRPAAKGPTE